MDQTVVAQSVNCFEKPGMCGLEAACLKVDATTSKCICPHDKSEPTADLKCLNRSKGIYYKNIRLSSFII